MFNIFLSTRSIIRHNPGIPNVEVEEDLEWDDVVEHYSKVAK